MSVSHIISSNCDLEVIVIALLIFEGSKMHYFVLVCHGNLTTG